jgi:hypothetical protein
LAAAPAPGAARRELWNQPRDEPLHLGRPVAAGELEQGLPAAQGARQSTVPVWEKAVEQRAPASVLREGVKQEPRQVVQVSAQQGRQASLQ